MRKGGGKCEAVRREVIAGTIAPLDTATGAAGYVAVEVKRKAGIDAVEQLTRYLERLNLDPLLRPVRGILVAQSIAPQAKVLAESRGIACKEVDYDELRGIESPALRLF